MPIHICLLIANMNYHIPHIQNGILIAVSLGTGSVKNRYLTEMKQHRRKLI
jgi:hypothetical protein